ncbi:VanZ family protein [Actinoplanes friuliensis]|uniref:VanZ family protein n=1 Tax=Actinoplanes friuliensis DSM 7358 TaxID=1246995 RepID=U5VNF8_9ACTN|nr:VanZ family protein [Actinoplanes friuliensis]AGZ38319.1 VanZ family protein [Actinoplanes friuliensis DSM 7358]
MGAAWRDHSTTILIALVVLPIGGAVVYLWRRRTVSSREAVAEIGFFAITLPFLGMLFTPQPSPRSIDLVPLHDLPSWFSGDPGTALAQIVGNLLVLAGFGFLPVRFAVLASLPRILALAVSSAVLIETLQWVLAIGRVSSIDDVLINTIGAVLAAALTRPWWAAGRAAPKRRSLPVA